MVSKDESKAPMGMPPLPLAHPPRPPSNSPNAADVQPMVNIEQPTHNDVLCGRGVTTNRHPGNESFRKMVGQNKELYVTSTKRQKMSISRSIVEAVRSLDPPGRFLEKNPITGLWSDVGDKKAVEKTSQALRDGAAELRKQLSEDLGDPAFLSAVFEGDLGAAELKSKDKEKVKPAKGKGSIKGHRRTRSTPCGGTAPLSVKITHSKRKSSFQSFQAPPSPKHTKPPQSRSQPSSPVAWAGRGTSYPPLTSQHRAPSPSTIECENLRIGSTPSPTMWMSPSGRGHSPTLFIRSPSFENRQHGCPEGNQSYDHPSGRASESNHEQTRPHHPPLPPFQPYYDSSRPPYPPQRPYSPRSSYPGPSPPPPPPVFGPSVSLPPGAHRFSPRYSPNTYRGNTPVSAPATWSPNAFGAPPPAPQSPVRRSPGHHRRSSPVMSGVLPPHEAGVGSSGLSVPVLGEDEERSSRDPHPLPMPKRDNHDHRYQSDYRYHSEYGYNADHHGYNPEHRPHADQYFRPNSDPVHSGYHAAPVGSDFAPSPSPHRRNDYSGVHAPSSNNVGADMDRNEGSGGCAKENMEIERIAPSPEHPNSREDKPEISGEKSPSAVADVRDAGDSDNKNLGEPGFGSSDKLEDYPFDEIEGPIDREISVSPLPFDEIDSSTMLEFSDNLLSFQTSPLFTDVNATAK